MKFWCEDHKRGPDESFCCPICENTEEWVIERAAYALEKLGLPPNENITQAIREGLALGYQLGTGTYDGTY